MGKSLELLGLAAFNVFIALILSATFLAKSGPSVSALTEDNIRAFVTEAAAVSGGQRQDMDSYGVTDYFMGHIADDGLFTSTIAYDMPDMPASERTMEMDKMKFISNVLQGIQSMTRHETAVDIEYIKITDNGKSAHVVTTNYERGVMPMDDGMGESNMVPVTGTSYCEQTLVLSGKNVIQMAGAKCNTNIDFSDAY